MRLINSRHNFGIILVLLSSICFAFVPNSAKIAIDEGASLFFLIVSRYGIGALLLLPVILATKTPIVFTVKKLFPVVRSSLLALGLIAATYHAINFLDIGLVLLILYAFPIGVAFMLHASGKEKITFKHCICILFVMIGLFIMIFDGGADINFYGLIISFVGLVCFVLFIIFSSDLAESMGSRSLNFYLSLFGLFFLLLVFLLPIEIPVDLPLSPKGFAAILANGFFYILSWVLFFEGSRIIGATRASLMACVEPLFAALLAIFFLNQMLSPIEWCGFFLVLVSVYLFERISVKKREGAIT